MLSHELQYLNDGARKASLRKSAAAGVALAPDFFIDASAFEFEQRFLFRTSWVAAGFSTDVPAAGDVFPVEIGGAPIVLVRQANGILAAFHNVCSHRGVQLVDVKQSGRKRIICPYHSWNYDLDGRLVLTPHAGGSNHHRCEALEPDKLSLKAAAVMEWAGVIFVRLASQGPSFEEFIAPLMTRWKKAHPDFASLRCDPDTEIKASMKANWKFVVENFVESYHVPYVHPALQKANPMERHYQILGGDTFLGQGGDVAESDGYLFSGLPKIAEFPPSAGNYEAVYLYPNLLFILINQAATAIIIQPRTADETHERLAGLFRYPEAFTENLSECRRDLIKQFGDVNIEDMDIVERLQKGRASPAFDGGVFVPAQETTSQQFHQLIARRLLNALGNADGSWEPLANGEIRHPEGDDDSSKVTFADAAKT